MASEQRPGLCCGSARKTEQEDRGTTERGKEKR